MQKTLTAAQILDHEVLNNLLDKLQPYIEEQHNKATYKLDYTTQDDYKARQDFNKVNDILKDLNNLYTYIGLIEKQEKLLIDLEMYEEFSQDEIFGKKERELYKNKFLDTKELLELVNDDLKEYIKD